MKLQKKKTNTIVIMWMMMITTLAYLLTGLNFGTGIMVGLLIAQIALFIWAIDKDRKGWTINIPDVIEARK